MPYDTTSGDCGGTQVVMWQSNTSGNSNVAALQVDGNLVVYDASSTALWNANTCSGCSIGGQGVRLYLPGATSSCPCKAYMCIAVDLSGGGVDYYYAETDGQPFTNSLVSCP